MMFQDGLSYDPAGSMLVTESVVPMTTGRSGSPLPSPPSPLLPPSDQQAARTSAPAASSAATDVNLRTRIRGTSMYFAVRIEASGDCGFAPDSLGWHGQRSASWPAAKSPRRNNRVTSGYPVLS